MSGVDKLTNNTKAKHTEGQKIFQEALKKGMDVKRSDDLFKAYDADGNGSLSKAEVATLRAENNIVSDKLSYQQMVHTVRDSKYPEGSGTRDRTVKSKNVITRDDLQDAFERINDESLEDEEVSAATIRSLIDQKVAAK